MNAFSLFSVIMNIPKCSSIEYSDDSHSFFFVLFSDYYCFLLIHGRCQWQPSYQRGYSTQRTYILFGKKKQIINEDLYLSNMRSNGFDGCMITGGGCMVVGPGDVNNDGS
jgi:hypothetical protein